MYSEFAVRNTRYAIPTPTLSSSPTLTTASSFHPHNNYMHPMEGVDSIIPDAYDIHDSDTSDASLPHPVQGTEALAQATKNLIALDSQQTPSWPNQSFQKLHQKRLPYSTFSPRSSPAPQSKPQHQHQQQSIYLPNTNNNGSPITHHYSFLPPQQQPIPPSDPQSSSKHLHHPTILPEIQPPPSKRSKHPSPSSLSPQDLSQPQSQVPKSTLLTPSQKKANHIQSEQKRRANIKRGYEALCETIPTLREAIRAEDEANAAASASALSMNGMSASAIKKRGRGGGVSKGMDDGDKLDGRAGPRSENVVLQKTIDHLRAQLEERDHLKQRLQRAEAVLPPGHPVLLARQGATSPPLWERQWYGGKNDDDEDHESDEGES